MKLEILKGSENYTCQVVKLPKPQEVKGLDNLVSVNIQGNDCLVSKDTNFEELHLFFPVGCKINSIFLSMNNLYRHNELNHNKKKSGFFEDIGRVKTLKLRGVISTGFVIPLSSLYNIELDHNPDNLTVGNEFNIFGSFELCTKYHIKKQGTGLQGKLNKIIDNIVDSKQVPEHFSTEHLMKNIHKLSLDDYIAVTYKLHGTSARYFNTLVKRKLNPLERILSYLGVNISTAEYSYITGSRKVLKSLNFESLPGKRHYYPEDLWTQVGEKYFKDKLNKGESVYCEIIGKDYTGKEIQGGYSYGLHEPKVYIYRISNINSQGIEVDLSYLQMKQRAEQLDIEVCPEFYYGKLEDFIDQNKSFSIKRRSDKTSNIEEYLTDVFYNNLLEKPSILDKSVVEEGFCIRVDRYPKPTILKIKSKAFLLHEGVQQDKQVVDIEDEQ